MMLTSTDSIFDIFTDLGATLVIPKEEFIEKTKKIKAFIFDWDGVFNDGLDGGCPQMVKCLM